MVITFTGMDLSIYAFHECGMCLRQMYVIAKKTPPKNNVDIFRCCKVSEMLICYILIVSIEHYMFVKVSPDPFERLLQIEKRNECYF